MATLSGQTIANTFDSLLHVEDDTAGLVATSTDSRVIQDGVGANSALALATDSVRITSTNKLYFNDVGGEYISGDGTNLTITSGADIILTVGAAGSVYHTGDGGTSNTIYGKNAGDALASGGNYNVILGEDAGTAITTGDENVCIGYQAGDAFDAESDNIFIGSAAGGGASLAAGETIAIGSDALLALVDGTNNIAIGHGALKEHTGGARNIAIGHGALDGTQAGGTQTTSAASNYNIALGWNALGGAWANAESNFNIAIGSSAMDAVMDGALSNTGVGHAALGALEEGVQNTVLGYQAGDAITGTSDANNGSYNTCVGSNAGGGITTGSQNVAVGQGTMNAALTTNLNTAVGDSALNTLTGGANNVVVGAGTATNLTTGGNNTYIGKSCDASASDVTNETAVGYGITPPAGGNSVTLGNASVTEVYCSSDKGANLYAASCVVTTGINFPDDASANPSGDVNTLDNYEEGVFQTSIGGGTVALSSGQDSFSYVKIGRFVMVSGEIAVSSASGSATMTIALPFEVAATFGDVSSRFLGSVKLRNIDLDDNTMDLSCYCSEGLQVANIYQNLDNTTESVLDVSKLSASDEITITLTYQAA